jgi:hypothetical protein
MVVLYSHSTSGAQRANLGLPRRQRGGCRPLLPRGGNTADRLGCVRKRTILSLIPSFYAFFAPQRFDTGQAQSRRSYEQTFTSLLPAPRFEHVPSPSVRLDLHGTLIDSQPGFFAGCLAALRALGHVGPNVPGQRRDFQGPSSLRCRFAALSKFANGRNGEARHSENSCVTLESSPCFDVASKRQRNYSISVIERMSEAQSALMSRGLGLS